MKRQHPATKIKGVGFFPTIFSNLCFTELGYKPSLFFLFSNWNTFQAALKTENTVTNPNHLIRYESTM